MVYLGFSISKDGAKPLEEKVKPIVDAPSPQNVTQLKSFLGMINYYHRHLPNMADTLEPLHILLRKDMKWKWEEQQEEAFRKAKSVLISPRLWVHFDPKKKVSLTCDASPYGLGAVLAHVEDDNSEKVIAYTSRTLSTAERNYSQIEKKALLSVVYAVRKFHQYLFGRNFKIYSDHKPLLGLIGESVGIPKMTAARIQRWALILSSYELEYKSGTKIGNADCLSRLPVDGEPDCSNADNGVHMLELSRAPMNSTKVKKETERDPVMSRVMDFVMKGWPDEMSASSEYEPYARRAQELSVDDGCLLWGSRVIIPPALRHQVLEELHMVHIGMSRMKALGRCYCWWPSMDAEVETYVKSCDSCLAYQNNPAMAPLHPWEVASKPWERVYLDYAGPFLGRMFLIITDAFSKWIDVHHLTTASSANTIEKLRITIATHGLPNYWSVITLHVLLVI